MCIRDRLYGIKTKFQRLSTSEVYTKISEEAGKPSADVWFGGTTDPYNEATADGLMEPYEAMNAVNLIGDQYKDPTNCWYGIYKGILGFMVNTCLLYTSTDEPKVAYIEFEGEGVITAADIQADADIEIMNPDQIIATLSGGTDSKFYMELTITKGRGYVSADKNKNDDLPIGVIAVDSIYTPVERVNMAVANTRVGQQTDYDKLTLEIYKMCIRDRDCAANLWMRFWANRRK